MRKKLGFVLALGSLVACKERSFHHGAVPAVAGGSLSEKVTVFRPEKPYLTIVGANNIGGRMAMTKQGGRFSMKLCLAFYGAGLFSRIKPEQVQRLSALPEPPPRGYFGTKKFSFSEIPAAKARLEKLVEDIRGYFETEFSSLEIVPLFPSDRDVMASADLRERDMRMYNMFLRNSLTRELEKPAAGCAQTPVPVIVEAAPDPFRGSPTAWDLYSKPWIFAHELAHILGVRKEGYELDGYPPDGLMNDEFAFHLVTELAPAARIALTQADLGEILISDRWEPALKRTDIERQVGDTSGVQEALKTGEDRMNYVGFPPEKKMELQRRAVLRWLER